MKNNNFEDKVKNWIKQYKELLDSLNIGFALHDSEFDCWFANDPLLEMLGEKNKVDIESRTIQKFNIRKVLSPYDAQKLFDLVNKTEKKLKGHGAVVEKKFYQTECNVLQLITGKLIPVSIRCSIHLDKDQNHDFTYVTLTDLSEQKRIQKELEYEKNKLSAILFGIGDSVSVYDTHGNLLLSNPKGIEIKGDNNAPIMPLQSASKEKILLKNIRGTFYYKGKMEVLKDDQGAIFAYVEILKDITNEIRLKEKENEFDRMKREMMRFELHSEMIGVSRAMRNIFDLIVRYASVDSTVLIQGETGVGKELVAKAIYKRSSRKGKPFVAVNCGALPENLLESELFGHVKGAFTGAIKTRKGLFDEADGGVLFLDEIGDLNPSLQVKVLRVLQEKEIRPVGSNKSYPVNVRVIAATNMDLKKMATQNKYRLDLYYRLAVISIFVPPLRDRKDDILPLAEHFIKIHAPKNASITKKFNHATQKILLNYSWPGNIRELENCIEHVWAMSRITVVKPKDLPVQIVHPEQIEPHFHSYYPQRSVPSELSIDYHNAPPVGLELKPWEIEENNMIEKALLNQKGNRTKAAKELGISRQTLWRKILLYKIDQ